MEQEQQHQEQWDSLWLGGNIETMDPTLGTMHDAALAVKDGKIAWIGKC